MGDAIAQVWQEIVNRPDGPMALRFYLQPFMATIFAVRDGVKDARAGAPPYLWAIFSEPEHRAELIRSGWRGVGKVFVLALVLDTIYQVTVLGGLRPIAGLIVAVGLAIVPYVLIRGPVNRLRRLRR